MSARGNAEASLVWYIKRIWEAADLEWASDNDTEVRSIVADILDAAKDDIRREVRASSSKIRSAP